MRKDSEGLKDLRPRAPGPPAPHTRPPGAGSRGCGNKMASARRVSPTPPRLRNEASGRVLTPLANGNEVIVGEEAGGSAGAGLCGRTHVEVLLPGAEEAAALVCGGCFGGGLPAAGGELGL